MGNRGRTSAAALSVIGPVRELRRAQAPAELTDEQADEWRAIVNRMPAEWFPRETHAMLAQYCRHVIAARRVAQLIDALEGRDPFDVEEYDRLLKMQEREGRALSSLATRMRLSQQATYDKTKRKPIAGVRPWKTEEDEGGDADS
jgi:hypothetical protein